MRQETDGVLLESFLIYEPEHQATWYKDDVPLLGALDFDEKYQPFLERRGDWTYCALAIRLNIKTVNKVKNSENFSDIFPTTMPVTTWSMCVTSTGRRPTM